MAVLVTGAAGFIGSHVVRRLLECGESVVGVDNLNDYNPVTLKRDRLALIAASPRANQFRFLEIDFADDASLDNALDHIEIDRIIHLGAQAGVRYSIDNPRSYVKSNLVGHVNILELSRNRKVSNLVYASSSSVYGMNPNLPFRIDEHVDFPVSLYAATKRSDELMSEAYAHLYRIPQIGLRFFTVYGPWGRPDMAVWGFTEKILAGVPIEVYNDGDMLRDFTFIDDIVSGVLSALKKPPADDQSRKSGGSINPHAIYNLGNNRPEKLEHLINLIEAACGVRAVRINKEMQPGDVFATYADISESERALGFAPRTPLDVGIPLWVEWYKDYRSRYAGAGLNR